jgi:hypothetical protein
VIHAGDLDEIRDEPRKLLSKAAGALLEGLRGEPAGWAYKYRLSVALRCGETDRRLTEVIDNAVSAPIDLARDSGGRGFKSRRRDNN